MYVALNEKDLWLSVLLLLVPLPQEPLQHG